MLRELYLGPTISPHLSILDTGGNLHDKQRDAAIVCAHTKDSASPVPSA
jgi:hypothetical protein